MLTIFDNFDRFQQYWQFLIISDNFQRSQQFLTIFTNVYNSDNFHNFDNLNIFFTILTIFDNWRKFSQFRSLLLPFWQLKRQSWRQFWQLRTWILDNPLSDFYLMRFLEYSLPFSAINCLYSVFCSGGWEFWRNIETKIHFCRSGSISRNCLKNRRHLPSRSGKRNLFEIDSFQAKHIRNLAKRSFIKWFPDGI